MLKTQIAKKIFLVVGSVLLLALLVTLVVKNGRGAETSNPDGAPMVRTSEKGMPTNVLLVGEDRTSGLYDVLMLLHVDPESSRASILQIPRDTYATYAEGSYRKINGAAKRLGGMEELCAFLSESLGVSIDRYVCMELEAFSKIVDALGGVEITLPDALHYDDPSQNLSIHLPKGEQTLDGKTAEYFVRYRMGYVRGDLGRMDAQKLFLSALAKKARSSLGVLSAVRLAITVLPYVETNLEIAEVTSLVRTAFSIPDEAVLMVTLPGKEAVAQQSGASYYVLSSKATYELLVSYFGATGTFDPLFVFRNSRYNDFCEIYDGYEAYIVYSMGEIDKEGIEIEKTGG